MSDQSNAKVVHERLLAALAAMGKAESAAVTLFAEVMKGKLCRGLGYASVHLYAEEALGFSRSKTYEFIRLAEARLEAMADKLMKKHHCSREQVLLMALESLLGESSRVDKGGSPYQVIVQKCPACESKTVVPQRRCLSPAESAQTRR